MSDVFASILKYTCPCGESDMLDDLFGALRQPVSQGGIPLVLFCAGLSGRNLHPMLVRHGIKPVCFCDNNPARAGEMFCGLPIVSFDELQRNHQKSLILIASTAYQGFVKKQLLECGFSSERILTLDTKDTSFDAQLRRERVLMFAQNGEPTAALEELRKDQERLTAAFHLFADEKSRDLFIRRLALVASGYEYQAYRNYLKDFSEPVLQYGYDNPERLQKSGSYFYFNNDVISLQNGEVFVDAGAFTGDSTDDFIEACKSRNVEYKRVYCFEPDAGNFEKLRINTARYRDINCINRGLWSCETKLRFLTSDQTQAYCARIQDVDAQQGMQGMADIHTATIDGELSGQEATLIKMDIEGAELEAIMGAKDTISKYRPKLALSVYHKISDLYEIPLLLNNLNPGYKLYLRHLSNFFDDTVLFAI